MNMPLRERRTLKDEWRDFTAKVMPPTASIIQRQEMRRAYYAGAASMFELLTGITGSLDADAEPTDLDLAYVSSLYDELKMFAAEIAAGLA